MSGFRSWIPLVNGSMVQVGLTRLAFVAQAVRVAFDVDDGSPVPEAGYWTVARFPTES